MCGIAGYLGKNKEEGANYADKTKKLLLHRGPDDYGVFSNDDVTLIHRRLSIVDLSPTGHQPMPSSCGRYTIVFNGEIYNHQELRKKYLSGHHFRGHSDTETIIELFRLKKERMLEEMVGMWAILIWDNETRKIFISRDRYGQKPLYIRKKKSAWYFSSEIRPLFDAHESNDYNATAVAEFIALGNYGHLGVNTFFNDIKQFPQGSYGWLAYDDSEISSTQYWVLPDVNERDKIPFDKDAQKKLHGLVVEAVLSQTMADVPIGITLSGGIDSSIITGILATYYDKEINIFTAQSTDGKYNETRYVDAVINKYKNSNFILHNRNLDELSVKDNLEKFINIQEEPFGDPSIVAHGMLMRMAADAGIKVILNGQGADELFFGYNNMAQFILLREFRTLQFKNFYDNLTAMKLGKSYLLRILMKSMMPGMEYKFRMKSRRDRRSHIDTKVLAGVDENTIRSYPSDTTYNVWSESIYGIHIPHLVHYDDRNGMACSVEGRSPFLDHRLADFLATVRPGEFLKNGLRKYMLRETCKQYLPEEIYNRTDKIGFHTPLANALKKDKTWVAEKMKSIDFIKPEFKNNLTTQLMSGNLDTGSALHIWRELSVLIWMEQFNVRH